MIEWIKRAKLWESNLWLLGVLIITIIQIKEGTVNFTWALLMVIIAKLCEIIYLVGFREKE